MKKIIIILFLFAFSFLTYREKIENAFIEKIDINLKKEEIGILFLPIYDSQYLLIKTKENSVLLPIYGEENPEKILKRFGEQKPTYSYTDNIQGKENKTGDIIKIDDITITRQNKNYIISNTYTNFCIYYEEEVQSTCDYIYFVKEKETLEDSIKLAFYNENISTSFERKLYDNWIDTYKIKKEECTLFTLHKDAYNVVKLPNYYFRLS